MATRRSGSLDLVLRFLAGALVVGCADGQGPGSVSDEIPRSRSPIPALIVSNPAVPGLAPLSTSRASLVDAVVYASLPTGSVSDGERIRFTNMATEADTSVAFVDGGFDPVAIPAAAGDSLRVELQ